MALGPKKWIPSEEDFQKIERFAGMGLSKEDTARMLGISHDTFFKRQNEMPEISESYKKGKAKTVSFVVSKLMELIQEKNLGAICFYLKTQAQWKENDPQQVTFMPIQFQLHSGEKVELGIAEASKRLEDKSK